MDKVAMGRRLERARKAANLKRKPVAERLGATAGAIQHHENGRSSPDLDTLAFYAKAYGVSMDWLVTGKGRGPGSVDEIAEVIRDLEALSPDDRERAISIFRAFSPRKKQMAEAS